MKKFGLFICKKKVLVCIISVILLFLSAIGMMLTKINFDILVYLPTDNETIVGQNILNDDFHMGAYSVVIVDNLSSKKIISLEEQIREVEGVDKVASIYDVTGDIVPIEMLPDKVVEKLHKENTDVMFITFDDSTSANRTLEAVSEVRKITGDTCRMGGMSSMVLDTKELSDKEIAIYIVIAVILCLLVLELSLDSFIVPILLLVNIGAAILFNLGTNIFLGEISYITKALVAVLQLGVTTDFSIFLYHSYEDKKKKYKDKVEAMSEAIADTFTSVTGSSLTTIAGFLVLCAMQLTLGKDLGIVMAKGVLFGVISVITLFPSLILLFDKAIDRTSHKVLLPTFKKFNKLIVKYNKVFLILFLVLLIPFYKANNSIDVYYKVDTSLPKTLDSIRANEELKNLYNIVSPEIILVERNIKTNKVNKLVDELTSIEGIDFALSFSKLEQYGITDAMISDDLVSMIQNDKYQAILINSLYEVATDELNEQITEVNKVVKDFDKNAIVAGEGPLMKDLIKISDEDFKNVNIWSIATIFVILFFVLKSFSLPFLLIGAIEFAIFVNMGFSYFGGDVLPFVAPIVLGTIQLGATIDYAILMTTNYRRKRKDGIASKQAMEETLNYCGNSVLVSGMCFFAATFGVGVYSELEMVGSLCTLISRGAIVSMLVVLTVLPSILITFDKLICKTEFSFGGKKMKNKGKKTLGLLMIISLLVSPTVVLADSKSETVYSKLNSDGSRKKTVVTERIENSLNKRTIVDYTTLKNIENLSNDNPFELKSNNKVEWNADGEDVIYQGETDKELPIDMHVTYKLDGKTMNVDDMLGKSGKITIEIKYSNKDKHVINGSTMYTPFIIATGSILSNDTAKNIKATNAKVISNGDKSIIIGLSVPGLAESIKNKSLSSLDTIKITYKTTNFASPGIYAAASSRLFNELDTSIFNKADTLFDSLDELQTNMDKIEDGAKKLNTGLKGSIKTMKNNNDDALDEVTLSGIVESAVTGVEAKFTSDYKTALKTQAWNKAKQADQTTVTTYVTSSLKDLLTISLGSEEYALASLTCASAYSELGASALSTPYCTSLNTLTSGDNEKITKALGLVSSYTNVLKSLTNNVSEYLVKETAVSTAYKIAKETAKTISYSLAPTVANSVKKGTLNTIADTLNSQLVPGVDELTNGITKFNNDGIKVLTGKAKTIKTALKKTRSLIQLGDAYDSFTCKANIDGETKFIMVIDGKEKEVNKKDTKKVEEERGLWQRIIDLF